MQKQFLCAFAIFAIVAAMTFGGADACRRCQYDGCSGCQQTSYVAVPSVPAHSYSVCNGCSGYYNGPSYLPKQYCGGCLRRKSLRLVDNCSCDC